MFQFFYPRSGETAGCIAGEIRAGVDLAPKGLWARRRNAWSILPAPAESRVSLAATDSTEAHAALQARLLSRRGEIEQAVLTRILAVADSTQGSALEYVEGVRAAVGAAIDYALSAICLGERRSPPPPPALLAQARVAARNGVNLETVLRRYFAGYTLMADFLVEEAEQTESLSSSELQGLLRSQAALLERIVEAVSEEHAREAATRLSSTGERRRERVERLLAGELVDVTELCYDFEAHHVGVIAIGPGAMAAIRKLAGDLGRRLLAVPCEEEEQAVWAWLGGGREVDSAALRRHASGLLACEVAMSIGEPAFGLAGWRLTHQQARAAVPIALRGPESVVHYGDVALLASALRDDLLVASLRDLFLAPLEAERNWEVLRETMHAYFASQGNVSSAATALGVKRQTVTNRLRMIEERLGRSLSTCTAEMEAALRLEEFGRGRTGPSGPLKTNILTERVAIPAARL